MQENIHLFSYILEFPVAYAAAAQVQPDNPFTSQMCTLTVNCDVFDVKLLAEDSAVRKPAHLNVLLSGLETNGNC